MKKIVSGLGLVFLLCSASVIAQVENSSVILDWRQHNLNKYNRMLINPGYSIAREQGTAVSFWSRIQWTGVNNAPQTFLINYSGKIGEHSGAGFGLYQQNLGLLSDSGLLMNYAYQVQLFEKAFLTLGLNSTLFRRGLNKNATSASDPDPVVLENQDDFLWLFMPGVNLSLGRFDLGFYAENLFDYNLNESRSVTDFNGKIYSGHLAVNHTFIHAHGILKDAVWRSLVYAKTQPNQVNQYGGNTMIDLPRTGWLQVGYNNTYGINGVLGIKLGSGMSIAVTYESGTNISNTNFGPTYEAMATIELGRNKAGNKAFAMSADIPRDAAPVAENTKDVEPPSHLEPVKKQDIASEYTIIGSEPAVKKITTVAEVDTPEDISDQGLNREEVVEKENESESPIVDRIVADLVSGEEEEEIRGIKSKDAENRAVNEMTSPDAQALAEELGMIASNEEESSELNALEEEKSGTYRTLEVSEGIEKGFYVVVNVFAREKYFKDFTRVLEDKGLEPRYFIHPKNNYWYVYLAYADNYYRAKGMQRTDLNGSYKDEKWIFWVK